MVLTVIVCGDFNIITDNKDKMGHKQCKIRREGPFLKAMMEEHQFLDVFRVLHPEEIDYTRFDSTGKSRIDRVYINNSLQAERHWTKLVVESDHLTVFCSIILNNEERRTYWKLNAKILKSSDLVLRVK